MNSDPGANCIISIIHPVLSVAHCTNQVIDHCQYDTNQAKYDHQRVRIDGVVLIHSQVSQMHLRHMKSRIELQTSLKVECCLFVFFLRLVYLAEGEVLQPGMVVR